MQRRGSEVSAMLFSRVRQIARRAPQRESEKSVRGLRVLAENGGGGTFRMPRPTRLTLAIVTALIATAAMAQDDTEVLTGHQPVVAEDSYWQWVKFDGANGSEQRIPMKIHMRSLLGASPGTHSIIWEITRTHLYNRVTGTVHQLSSPDGITNGGMVGVSGPLTQEPMAAYWQWFGGRPNDEQRYGQFLFIMKYRQLNTGPYTSLVNHTWIMRPQDYASASNGSNQNGNNQGGTGSGGGGITEGFFEGLFVPDQECLDDFVDAAKQFMDWGPFGWFSIVAGLHEGSRGYRIDGDEQYKIKFGVEEHNDIAPGVGGNYEIDLTPYSGVIVALRTFMAGLLWYYFIFGIGRRVYEKI